MDQEIKEKLDQIMALLQGLGPTPTAGGMLSRKDAVKALGIGLTTLGEMIRSGEIVTRKIGARVLIPHSEIRRLTQADIAPEPRVRGPRNYNAKEEAEKMRAHLRKRKP